MTQYIADTVSCGGVPYFEYRYSPEPIDSEPDVRLITIEFAPSEQPDDQYQLPQPRFRFSDRVKVIDPDEPNWDEWSTFIITGMKHNGLRCSITNKWREQPQWRYELKRIWGEGSGFWASENEICLTLEEF
jgi:hypothetical protein